MALDNFRTIELIWDKANKSIIKTIKTASSDTTGRYLSVKILDGGQEVTFDNATLQLYWEHPNFNTSGTDNFNTINNGGLFKMTFSNEMLANIGELNAYLILTLSDGKITSDGFPIKVFKGADDGVVVPTNGSGLVEQVARKIDKGNVTLNDLTQEVKLAMTGGSVAIVDENAVGTENIKDKSVTAEKLDTSLQNLLERTAKIGVDDLSGSLVLPVNTVRFNDVPATLDGYVRKISFNIKKAGSAKLKVVHKNDDGTCTIVASRNISFDSVGEITLYENVDFEPLSITNGDYLAWYGETAEIAYDAGGSSYYATGNRLVNETLVFTSNAADIKYNYLVSREGTLPEDVRLLKGDVQANKAVVYQFGNQDIIGASMISSAEASTRVDSKPITESGLLDSVSFRTNSTGIIKVKFFEKNEDMFTFKNEVIINTRLGLNTYEKNVDFIPIEIESGWLVGFYSDANQPKVPFSVINSGINSYTFPGIDVKNQQMNTSSAYYSLLMSLEVSHGLEHVKKDIDTLKNGVPSEKPSVFEANPTLLDERFSGDILPTNWVNNGFSVNNGLHFSGLGDMTKVAYKKQWSTMDHALTRVVFTPHNTSPDLAIYKRDLVANGFNGYFRLDGVNKKIIMYEIGYLTDTELRPVLNEVELTIPIVAERPCLLELERDMMEHTVFRITDTLTGKSQQIENDLSTTGKNVMNKGYTGVSAFGGDFTVNRVSYGSREKVEVQLAIFGDSFVEASTMSVIGTENSYSNLLKQRLSGSVHINGSGGETTTGLVAKLPHDFDSVKAKYTLLAIGTNDTSFTTWVDNMQLLIQEVKKRGSIPVLITLAPRGDTDKISFNTNVNNWVRSSGYKYIDIALVTSLNYDGISYDPSLFFDDKIHPNKEGHFKIYNRSFVDVPEIFDGY